MTPGFAKFAKSVLRGEWRTPEGEPLSLPARVLYGLIVDYSHGGERSCSAGQELLGDHLGLSPRTVYNLTNELERAGAIRKTRRGRGKSNLLYPLVPYDRNPASDQDRNSASTEGEPPTKETTNGGWVGQAVEAQRGERA